MAQTNSGDAGTEIMETGDGKKYEVLKAAKRGEGSRGGKIIGHTKSGKPVYGPTDAHWAAVDDTNRAYSGGRAYRQGVNNQVSAVHAHALKHDDFTAEEHDEAAAMHKKHDRSSEHYDNAHRSIAAKHKHSAEWLRTEGKKKGYKTLAENPHFRPYHEREAGNFRRSVNSADLDSDSSTGDNMSYEELFKSELGEQPETDEVVDRAAKALAELSEEQIIAVIEKASSYKEANHALANNTQPEVGGKAGPRVSTTRVKDGAKRFDDVVKGDEESLEDAMEEVTPEEVVKSRGPIIGGSEWVQYVDTGFDRALADQIEKGFVGEAAITSQPIDKHNAPTR